MIHIQKEGKDVQIKIEYHVPYGQNWVSTFTHTRTSEHNAELLFAVLLDALNKRVTEIRTEAYNEGWKDKAAKRIKRKWFSCQM